MEINPMNINSHINTPSHQTIATYGSHPHRIRIVKLGGSLLENSNMPFELHDWLARQPISQNIIVVGGGRMADEIRQWDQRFSLGNTPAHWLCIQVMSITANALATALKTVPLFDSLEKAAQLTGQKTTCVLDVLKFLRHEEPHRPGIRIPHDWCVSSDSIAARIANVLSADELVLLKSAAPPKDLTIASAAKHDYVDKFLPKLADDLGMVRCVNSLARGWPDWILKISTGSGQTISSAVS